MLNNYIVYIYIYIYIYILKREGEREREREREWGLLMCYGSHSYITNYRANELLHRQLFNAIICIRSRRSRSELLAAQRVKLYAK